MKWFAIPVLIAALGLAGGWWWLRSYTRHNTHVRVPELSGLTLEEAREKLGRRKLFHEVIDSVHSAERPKGTVVEQDPLAGSEVKPDRKVYLVMNAMQPQMIDMPDLVDMSKRQAISVLEILGLRVAELRYEPDPCVDCVIEQLHNEQPIVADTKVRKGEAIVLVLGSGESGERVPIPDLRGLTRGEVQAVVNMASLNMGVVVECRGCNTPEDSAFARVYRQTPQPRENDRVALGGLIDVWLTADTTGLRPVPHDTTSAQEIPDDAEER
ncbi:MAG: PASTA domain-containing protein [Flavobacteriales bacterium]|nr:PASTA domain-containing protein [Flavobacteriales bacterium]